MSSLTGPGYVHPLPPLPQRLAADTEQPGELGLGAVPLVGLDGAAEVLVQAEIVRPGRYRAVGIAARVRYTEVSRRNLVAVSQDHGALDRVLAPEWKGILSLDLLEAYARRGWARYKLGDLARAERDYKRALKTYRKDIGNPAMLGNRWVSMAQYEVGQIYSELFAAIRFRLPIEEMARDLEDKSNLFIKAQNAYVKAVRHHHRDFAVKSGFQLGALFERMYDDMMAAEVPDDLTEEEMEIYYAELRKHVKPLVTKAIDIYERNIQLGRRLKGGEEWVKKTEAGLARLKEVLRTDAEKDALEALK